MRLVIAPRRSVVLSAIVDDRCARRRTLNLSLSTSRGKIDVINRSEVTMRRPGDKQTPAPGGRAAARLRQYIEQRSGTPETSGAEKPKRASRATKRKPPKKK